MALPKPKPLLQSKSGQQPSLQELRAAEAAARAAEAREKLEAEKRAEQAAASKQAALGVQQAAEAAARAEHLKKQRDLILAQRKKQREAEAAKYEPPPAATAHNAAAPPVSMRRAAGYDPNKVEAPPEHRAQLSRALASNMKASLVISSNELQHQMLQTERRADMEAAKAHLRAEAAAM